jgi:VWFA-related protein
VSRAELVTVHASVTSPYGFRLTDLAKDEFEVLDNGRVREILQFALMARPVDISVLLDRSGSYRAWNWPTPVRTLLESLHSHDRISVHTLQRDLQPLTSEHALITAVVEGTIAPDGASPIWRGLERVVRNLTDSTRSRAVIMFTDGQDDGAGPPPRSLTDAARRSDVALYLADTSPVIITSGRANSEYERRRQAAIAHLDFLMRTTGGRRISMPGPLQAPAVYRAFVDELRDQYVLGFQPESFDGKFHDLKVRVKRPGATVTARAGYLAVRR